MCLSIRTVFVCVININQIRVKSYHVIFASFFRVVSKIKFILIFMSRDQIYMPKQSFCICMCLILLLLCSRQCSSLSDFCKLKQRLSCLVIWQLSYLQSTNIYFPIQPTILGGILVRNTPQNNVLIHQYQTVEKFYFCRTKEHKTGKNPNITLLLILLEIVQHKLLPH